MKKLAKKDTLSQKEIDDFDKIVKNTQDSISKQIGPNIDKPKIILIGMTGSGKSSLACSLSDQELLIQPGKGKNVKLIGKGIVSGRKSGTTEPSIIFDSKSNILYCDCPGFDDTRGFLQEIINSFAISNLLDISGADNLIKILLVISDPEFKCRRGISMTNSLFRLESMFPHITSLINGIGLVITKGPITKNGSDYIDELEEEEEYVEYEDTTDTLTKWYKIFKKNLNHVFVFPEAASDNLGECYDFDDKEKLKEFIQSNYIINPEHKISLSDGAIQYMKQLRLTHGNNVNKAIDQLFIKIQNQLEQEQSSNELEKWIDIMHELFLKDINNVKGLYQVLKEMIPNNEQYQEYFDKLAEYEPFDHFLDEKLFKDDRSSCLKDAIRMNCNKAIHDLAKIQTNLIRDENNKKEYERQMKLMEEKERLSNEHKIKYQQLQQILETINSENQKRSQAQIEEIKKSFLNQKMQMEKDFKDKLNKLVAEKGQTEESHKNEILRIKNDNIESNKQLEEQMNKQINELIEANKRKDYTIGKLQKKIDERRICLIQ